MKLFIFSKHVVIIEDDVDENGTTGRARLIRSST